MSFGLYAIFRPSVKLKAPQNDGVALLSVIDELDVIAAKLGVPALGSYTDARELPMDFDGDPDEAMELLGPRTDWYPIVDGLHTIDALIEHLRAGESPRVKNTEQVLQDLLSVQKILMEAKGKARHFRLEGG